MTRFLFPLVAFFLLVVVPCLVSAYSIELPAATKECFFEDLHENDKVCGKHAPVLSSEP
jgi:p24 family protein beta-1